MSVRRLPARAFLLLRRGAESLVANTGARDAAQMAYFLVMSFPAILLLLVWCFSALLHDDSVRESIVDAIVGALPLSDPADRRQVERLLDDVTSGAGSLGWIGAVSLLYSASGAIGALRHAVNRAWGERDTRPYLPGKALDAGLTLVVAPILIAGLGLTLSGSLADAIGDHPWVVGAAQFTVTELLPIALLLAVVVGLFRVLPVTRSGFRAALLGGLVAVAGVALVQLGGEAYFSVFGGDRGAVYGTLGVLLAVVFSAYLDAIAIIYGAHVAAQAALLPSAASIDRALERERENPTPVGRQVLDGVRGLFVRIQPPSGRYGRAVPIRVAVGEDSVIVREGLQQLLASSPGIEVVASCADLESLLEAVETESPDVVLTDIRMPPSETDEGIQIAARLRESHPEIGVVVLSQFSEPSYVLDLLESGSDRRGYLLKERVHNRGELVSAIDAVAQGGSVIDPKIVEVLVTAKARAARSPLSELTPREQEVLAEIAKGKSNTAIAEALVLTKRAVEKHINSIFMKLGLAASDDVSKRVKATLLFLADADVAHDVQPAPGPNVQP